MSPKMIAGGMFALLVAAVSSSGRAQDRQTDGPARMLMVTQSAGFRHGAVTREATDLSPAERIVTELGISSNLFRVDCTQDCAADFTRDKLQYYDIVLFYTTGDLPIAQDDLDYFFEEWLTTEGHGFIGTHSAADTFHNYQPYWDMIGGTFNGHPWNQSATVTINVHDTGHPVSRPWGESFTIQDEIYQFKNWQPEKVRVLMSLDMAETELKRPYHVPIAWVKEYGEGRVMHMSLGHRIEVWENETFQQSLLGGVQWILGQAEGSGEPNPEVSLQQEEAAKEAFEAAGN